MRTAGGDDAARATATTPTDPRAMRRLREIFFPPRRKAYGTTSRA
jgi:hypothetical protein